MTKKRTPAARVDEPTAPAVEVTLEEQSSAAPSAAAAVVAAVVAPKRVAIRATRPGGFRRLGRLFVNDKDTVLDLSELSASDRARLEEAQRAKVLAIRDV